MLSLKFLRQLDWSLTATLSVRRRSRQITTLRSSLPPAPRVTVDSTPSNPPPSRPLNGPGLAKALPSHSNVIPMRARKAG